MTDSFSDYIDKNMDKIVSNKAHVKDKSNKKPKSISVVNLEFIETVDNIIKEKTERLLIPVGALRRKIDENNLPDCLEYLTLGNMQVIALALGLPGAIKVSETCKKIEHQYHEKLKIIIRHIKQPSLIYSLFWYTNTREYNNCISKLLKLNGHKISPDGLVNVKTNKIIECIDEKALINTISDLINVSLSTKFTDRSDEYSNMIKSKYKQQHKPESVKTNTKSVNKSTNKSSNKSKLTKKTTKKTLSSKGESDSE